MNYNDLDKLFNASEMICDPIDFQVRKKNLLNGIAQYLLERDKPIAKEESDDIIV